MAFHYTIDDLKGFAQTVLDQAKQLGASDASVDVAENLGLTVNVRMGKVDTIEHHQDKSLSVTVHLGRCRGNASSTDFSPKAIEQAVRAALDIAKFTAEDPFAALPEPNLLCTDAKDFDLYHPWSVTADEATQLALETENAALEVSPQVANSDGAGVSTEAGHFFSMNSQGFAGGYAHTRHSLSVAPIAHWQGPQGLAMQRDFWYSTARSRSALADPVAVGQYAAHRALSRLNAQQVPTQICPVLFEAPVAIGLLGSFVQAVSGGALYREASFLLNSLGQQVWADHIQLFEDPFILQGMASGSFDDEGVATQQRSIVVDGVLEGYFLSCYSARKLGMQTTGNSGGTHNLMLSSKHTRPEDDLPAMLKKLHRGLFVTELMGQGVNLLTGDYSRGAFGYWVENGEIAYPVEEITIAGNLRDMLQRVVAVGADSLWRGSKFSGSLLIDGMTVASNLSS